MFNCLSEIQSFRANKLRPVQTKVVTSDGKHYVESRDRSGAIVAKEVKREQPIFVPDLTPDLQVAQILPGLGLGSQDVAQDLNTLKTNNITHILNLAAGVQNAFAGQFVYKSVNVLDEPATKITDIFDECFTFIDDARKSGGTCLVHCNAGISRAATIVIAYLMKSENLSFTKAMETVSAKRAVKPNDGFLRQLQNYDEELQKLRAPNVVPAVVPPVPIQRQESTQPQTKPRTRNSVQAEAAAAAPPPPPPPPPQVKAVPRQASITANQKPSSPVPTPPKPSSPVPTPPKTASPVPTPPKPASPVQQPTPPKSSSPVQKSTNVVAVRQRQVVTQQQTTTTTSGQKVHHIPIQLEESEEEESEEEESEEEEEEDQQPQQRTTSKTGHYSQSVTVTIMSKKK